VEAFSRDDVEGVAALLAKASLPEVALTLARMLAKEHQHCRCIADGSFRTL
jgi:hypothetical protein